MPWLFIDGSPDTSTRRGDCEELPRWVSEVGPSSWGILIWRLTSPKSRFTRTWASKI